MNLGRLYPDDDSFRVSFKLDLHRAVQEQLRDNKGALYARLQAIALQLTGHDVNKNDFLTLLCEMPLPTSAITDNFGVESCALMSIRSTEPISIISCLQCRVHLPDLDRRTLLRQLRILNHLGRFNPGDLVEWRLLSELFCNCCSDESRLHYAEQFRTESLTRQGRTAELQRMPFDQYQKTPEWKVLRNRVLIRAGNRCQICGSAGRLDVHHRTYERYGEELLEDLVALCRSCHQIYHDILPKVA